MLCVPFDFTVSSPYISLPGTAYKGNFHAHSTESDGTGTPTEMITGYRDAGYHFSGLSEHEYLVSGPTADPGVSGELYIPCLEKDTTDMLNPGEVHVVRINVAALEPSSDLETIIDNAMVARSWCYVAHPLDETYGGITAAEVAALDNLQAIAVHEINGIGGDALWNSILDLGKIVWGIVDDDAHAVAEIGGRGFIVVHASDLTATAIVAALRAGKFYASEGPSLTITDDGKKLAVSCAQNCNWIVYGSGGVTLQTANNTTSITRPYFGDEGYVRVKATRISDNKRAWINPAVVS